MEFALSVGRPGWEIAMFGGTSTMRPIARWLLAGLLVTGGNACTTVLAPERTEALGPPFNDALKEGYLQLDSLGLNVATTASRAAQLRAPARVSVVGYADLTGPARLNEALSLQRAENVAAALARAGVSPDLIDVQARGATGAAADGRRVEITFDS